MILSPQDVKVLTHRVRPRWQARELEHLHIPYRTRTDGTLVVLWEDVRAAHDVQPRRREPQVRLDA